jgi:hypothetical protein
MMALLGLLFGRRYGWTGLAIVIVVIWLLAMLAPNLITRGACRLDAAGSRLYRGDGLPSRCGRVRETASGLVGRRSPERADATLPYRISSGAVAIDVSP